MGIQIIVNFPARLRRAETAESRQSALIRTPVPRASLVGSRRGIGSRQPDVAEVLSAGAGLVADAGLAMGQDLLQEASKGLRLVRNRAQFRGARAGH